MVNKIVQLKDAEGNKIYPVSISDKPTLAGVIIPYAGNGAPQGFLPCDGSAVSRTTYSILFNAIGILWGAGNGSTTFNLPNLNGRTLIGKSDTYSVGNTGGEETHTLTIAEIPRHNHSDDFTNTTSSATDGYAMSGGYTKKSSMTGGYTGGGEAHNNMQPYATANYIISTGIDSASINSTIEDPHGEWCTAYGSPSITLSTTTTADSGLLSFQSIVGKSCFSLSSDGGIICPYTGTIIISGEVNLGTGFTQNDLIHLRFTKNGSHILHDVIHRMPYSGYGTIQHTGGFQSINAGDIIRVRLYNQTAARGTIESSTSGTRLNIAYI